MSPPAIDGQYAQAVEDYVALRKIIPKFRTSDAWLRDTDDLSYRIRFIEYSFDGMLKDIEKAEGTAAMKNFIYEVSYHMHSAHAHATADGMRQFKTLGQQKFFTCELGFNSGDRTVALQGANTYLSWLLSHVAAYLGLSDVEAAFDQWIANIQARHAAAGPGASHAGP